MYNTVIFDLDGTLLDTLADLAASVNYALRTHHLPERSITEVRAFLGNGIKRLMLQAVGKEQEDDAFLAVFHTFREHYMAHCLDATRPYDGILPTLEAMQQRDVKMAIVSNKLHPAVQELNRHFFARYITTAVGESATVRRKPNPDAVLAAMQALGSKPEECLYVGDSEVDWLTAQHAGIDCALVLWGFRDEDYLRTLSGVKAFLSKPHDLLMLV